MQLLLPPSEAKARGGRGRPLRERTPSGPLAAPRETVRAALQTLLRNEGAAQALRLPPGVAAEALATNAAMFDAPTMPALRRYTGVVYDGLDYPALGAAEQRLADRSVWIMSGLFGAVRGDEPVPAYRVPAKATLPGIGVTATFWRPILQSAMPMLLGHGLVIDLRSTDYAAMWRPGPAAVAVRILSPAPRGGYAVISYQSKLAKGRLTAALLTRAADGVPVTSSDDIVAAWIACGGGHAVVPAPGRLDLYE